MLDTASLMGIKKRRSMDIIYKISMVVANFEKYAMGANIREETYSNIRKVLDQNKIEV